MKTCLSKLSWYNNDNVWVTGFIRNGNKYLTNDELLNVFSGTGTISEFEQTLMAANEINPSPSQKSFQRVKEKIKAFIPYKLKNIFIQNQSPVFYDEITGLMIKDMGYENIVHPKQSNYYNSYITQWYLFKTRNMLNIKEHE